MAVEASGGRWRMYRHHEFVDREIRRLVLREVPERVLVIQEPPRHGKSEHVSHWLPAWFLREWPDGNVGLASYEARFARSWGRKSRDTWTTHALERGLRLDPSRDAANDWGIQGEGGGMITTGVGGPITGRGFNVLIVDDPIKNSQEAMSETIRNTHWEWWESTVLTRLEPNGVVVVMQTRWHRDDLAGRILAAAADGTGFPARLINLPALAEEGDQLGREPGEALWPERWPREELEHIRATRSPYWWQAMYQQRPSQHDAAEWPDTYFDDHIWCRVMPTTYESSAIAVDYARGRTKRGDYAASTFVGWTKNAFHVDSQIRRRPAEKLCVDIVDMAVRRRPDVVYIEGNGGQDLVRLLVDAECRRRAIPPFAIITQDSHDNKHERIRRLGPRFLAHQFRFLDTSDNRLLIQQCREFPIGDFDDGPDVLEMATRSVMHVATSRAGTADQSRPPTEGTRWPVQARY